VRRDRRTVARLVPATVPGPAAAAAPAHRLTAPTAGTW